MTLREIIGLIISVISLALMPVAWMFSRILWVVSAFMLVLGLVLFYTERMARRTLEFEKQKTGGSGSPSVPTDIHNYSGWRTGGRSETMDHSETSDGD